MAFEFTANIFHIHATPCNRSCMQVNRRRRAFSHAIPGSLASLLGMQLLLHIAFCYMAFHLSGLLTSTILVYNVPLMHCSHNHECIGELHYKLYEEATGSCPSCIWNTEPFV